MTSTRLPFSISVQSLTFYIKGRPFSLTRDHGSYAAVREHLQRPDAPHDADWLHSMVDVRAALFRESQGRIVFDGDDVIFQGKPLHNVWVDKILDFRNAGEDFSPVWNALDKLVHNPTPAAIERLPVFLERTKLGFLPDGRFIAFKGVQADFCSAHRSPDGTRFTHQIGDKPRMAREDVDADPNRTCSTGLHVGAPGYVRQHYSGGDYALVLVAVDPVDVVSVPTDYNGEKMRVCGYEVIDHLDQDYSDELLGKLRTTVTGYTPAPAEPDLAEGDEIEDEVEEDEEEEQDEFDLVEPGDVIKYESFGSRLFATVLRRVDDGNLIVRCPENDDEVVDADDFVERVRAADIEAPMVAHSGCQVEVSGDSVLRDGTYEIVGMNTDDNDDQDDSSGHFFLVRTGSEHESHHPVGNSAITRVTYQGVQLFPRTKVEVDGDAVTLTSLDGHDLRGEAEALLDDDTVEVGDLVQVVEHTWPPAGVYPVVKVLAHAIEVQTEHDGIVTVEDGNWHLHARQS